MSTYEVNSIGKIYNNEKEVYIKLDTKFIPALKALKGFSHINIIWWFSDFDSSEYRTILQTSQPYKKAPEKMGIFATRSPIRPNPLALSTVEIIYIDYQNGIIRIPYIDANNGSTILDIKPYTPSLDRIESPNVPEWCNHWPKSLEESADFAWEDEFNF